MTALYAFRKILPNFCIFFSSFFCKVSLFLRKFVSISLFFNTGKSEYKRKAVNTVGKHNDLKLGIRTDKLVYLLAYAIKLQIDFKSIYIFHGGHGLAVEHRTSNQEPVLGLIPNWRHRGVSLSKAHYLFIVLVKTQEAVASSQHD